MNRLWKFFTSLRLTVVLLAFGIVLVFIGTIAQADEGLYNAQTRYFRQWLVVGVNMFGKRIPLALPGGYLIGTLLLVNLLAAHIQRFQWTWKKLGIHLTHAGVMLLLVGQLTTDLLSRETQIRIEEGAAKTYSESSTDYELAFTTDAGVDTEEVVAIPQSLLGGSAEIKHEKLPFTIRVKSFNRNTEPSFRAPMTQNAPPLTTNGLGQYFDFQPVAEAKSMDEKNVPAALIELTGATGSLGDWVVAGWAGDAVMAEAVERSYGRQMGAAMASNIGSRLTAPQSIEAGGKKFTFTLRPAREYNPFSLTLLKATHSVYPGTVTATSPQGIPKDFRSRIRLENPQTGEDREVEIYMNSPLRYGGLTFYQFQMSAGEAVQRAGETPSSVLQVVRNPSWLTPYVGCALVGAGLVTQFMMHLVAFLSRRRKAK